MSEKSISEKIAAKTFGSIELARSLCFDIAGPTDEDDNSGSGYGSVDIAEILSAEIVRLRKMRGDDYKLEWYAKGQDDAAKRCISIAKSFDEYDYADEVADAIRVEFGL